MVNLISCLVDDLSLSPRCDTIMATSQTGLFQFVKQRGQTRRATFYLLNEILPNLKLIHRIISVTHFDQITRGLLITLAAALVNRLMSGFDKHWQRLFRMRIECMFCQIYFETVIRSIPCGI